MNKNISIWRGSQAPPTIHHVWIKEDNSIYLHNGTDWEITIDKDIYDKVQEFIDHQGLMRSVMGGNVQVIEWSHTHNMNDYKTAGTYRIKGERTGNPMDDNLPIMNQGSGHTIDGILYVLDSSLANGSGKEDDCTITQFLMLSNRVGGQEGDMYMRSAYGANKDSLTWKPWEKYQTNMEVGVVSDDATHDATTLAPINSNGLKTFVDNGMYSGVYLTQEALNGDSTKAQTFVMVVINNYAAAGDYKTFTQIKFAVTNAGEYSMERRSRGFDGKWSGWINEYNDLSTRMDEAELRIGEAEKNIALNTAEIDQLKERNLAEIPTFTGVVDSTEIVPDQSATQFLGVYYIKSKNVFAALNGDNYYTGWQAQGMFQSSKCYNQNGVAVENRIYYLKDMFDTGKAPSLVFLKSGSFVEVNYNADVEEAITSLQERAVLHEDSLTTHGKQIATLQTAEKELKSQAIAINDINYSATADNLSIDIQSIDGGNSGSVTLPAATTEKAGVMSAEDKSKLDKALPKSTIVQETGDSETLVMSQKAVSEKLTELSVKSGDKFFELVGKAEIDIPSSSSGWHYYPIPILKNGETYSFALNLSEASPLPIYWTIRVNGSTMLFVNRVINAGELQATFTYTLSANYSVFEVGLYSGAQIPPFLFSILSKYSILGDIEESVLTLEANAKQIEEDLHEVEKTVEQLANYSQDDFSYGVEWDVTISSPACSRIGNINLHRYLPVQSKMRGCLLDDDGNVVEYLNPNDWTDNVLDGSKGQVMVEIPAHYRKFETEGNKRRVRLSEIQLAGYHLVPRCYVSAYEATVQRSTNKLSSVKNTTEDYRGGNNNSEWDGTDRSLLGMPATSISRTNLRAYARKRNTATTEWNCMTYDIQKELYWLFVIEYATLNSQAAYNAAKDANGYMQGGLGDGVTTWDGTSWSNFNGYNPFIPCGHTDSLGNASGIVAYTVKDSANADLKTFNVPRYRGVENPFGHIWQWTDGVNVRISPTSANGGDDLSKVFVCSDPALFTDSSYNGYSHVGNEARAEGYAKSHIFGEYGEIIPDAVGGGSTTYMCDYHYTNIPTSEALRGVLFGGHANIRAAAGFGYATSDNVPSSTYANFGSRLCFIPAN